jgi:hypothetical protein
MAFLLRHQFLRYTGDNVNLLSKEVSMTSQVLDERERHDVAEIAYERAIDDICGLNWKQLSPQDLINVAWAYYYFSVQFRENLEIARSLYPGDEQLLQLDRGERDTDNLSPWPGVAAVGERMNHDEFMRRTLALTTIDDDRRRRLEALGQSYLTKIRTIDPMTRALSIASYEDGGLESVFQAMLTAQYWDDPLLQSFKHFLTEHIRFDSDPDQGHGALCRHLVPNDQILPLWNAFRQILLQAAPALAS